MNHRFKIFLLSVSIMLLIFGCTKKEEQPSIKIDKAISADGVSISYQVQGEGKPALVFVHGWCCDRSYWDAQLPHFAQKYKVVAIDLAGHGDSGLERKDYTMTAFSEDVVSVVKKLDLEQVILIGHSMAGKVIVETSVRMPERIIGLVAVDTFHNVETRFNQEEINRILAPSLANFVEATDKFVRTMFLPTADSALVEKIVADMSSAPREVGLGALENYLSHDMRPALQKVRASVFAINSDMRPTEVEVNQRYAPSFKAVLMSGVGHFVMIESPETFNRLLEEVVQEFVRMKASE